MISDFFIRRPVLANVLAILMVVIGIVALFALPVAQYPDVVPPTVQVTTRYPGASARTVIDAVALPIEQQVNGVEGMIYMQSYSAADGTYTLTVTFKIGVDLNVAQILVQNRVSSALSSLPQAVQAQGVVVQKNSTAILQIVTLTSPDQRYDSLYLANFATIKLKDEIARLPGVGNVVVFGAGQYSMRIWLDPDKMRARGLVPQDVIQALQQQSEQVTAGQIGAPPAPSGQSFQYTLNVAGKLSDPAEFAAVIVKTGQAGEITRVRDVATVELGAQTYGQVFSLDGKPAAGLAIFQAPGANALEVAGAVNKKMAALTPEFPPGLVSSIPFDTTKFVQQSIHEVYKTLYEAAILVLIVILVFLQDWRAMLIPATTVPVTIIGAFAAMAALGFTVNFSTLFAIVLAIGIVVDDAIVVVEGAVHNIEKGMSGREAASAAMRELFGPIIGITLVLMSVFLPAAFLPGLTGRMYAQFALVIAATALISAINAATLKPTQAAMWLRPAGAAGAAQHLLSRVQPGLRRDRAWLHEVDLGHGQPQRADGAPGAGPHRCHRFRVLARSHRLPADRRPGLHDRSGAVARRRLARAHPEGARPGQRCQPQDAGRRAGGHHRRRLAARQQRDAVERRRGLHHPEGLERARQRRGPAGAVHGSERVAQRQPEADILVMPPPPIQGVGNDAGFTMQVQLRDGSFDMAKLQSVTNAIVANAKTQTAIQLVLASFRSNIPQYSVEVDRVKTQAMHVSLDQVFAALGSYLGSSYVDQFNKFGRVFQIYVQGDAQSRLRLEDIENMFVRNRDGQMVPLGTLVTITPTVGPSLISLFNLYPTATIIGLPADGFSSGEVLTLMEEIARRTLPPGTGFEWSSMSFQEKLVGQQMYMVFGLALLLVYLVLAGQYESWYAPVSVILAVPLSFIGPVAALLALSKSGLNNNLYVQIGLVLLMALSAKNAILIVEFARELRERGMTILESAVGAARARFRPIVMTSLAFILGVVPLVFASGAGASARASIGITVFTGMIASTCLAVLFVPPFFVLVQGFEEWRARRKAPTSATRRRNSRPPRACDFSAPLPPHD